VILFVPGVKEFSLIRYPASDTVTERKRVPAAKSFLAVSLVTPAGKTRLSSCCGVALPTQFAGVDQRRSDPPPPQIRTASKRRSSSDSSSRRRAFNPPDLGDGPHATNEIVQVFSSQQHLDRFNDQVHSTPAASSWDKTPAII